MVVSGNHGVIIYAQEFASFIEEMGQKMYVCCKGEARAKVKNVIKFLKYKFLASHDFEDEVDANESVKKWLKRSADGKLSQATKGISL